MSGMFNFAFCSPIRLGRWKISPRRIRLNIFWFVMLQELTGRKLDVLDVRTIVSLVLSVLRGKFENRFCITCRICGKINLIVMFALQVRLCWRVNPSLTMFTVHPRYAVYRLHSTY